MKKLIPIKLHVAHAAHHGHSKILIQTVDTDVVAIAVRIFQLLEALQQLWIAFGTGKCFRYLSIREIAAAMGPQKALALPMFHALTGCDTVSAFTSHGKRTAWITWNSFPELIEALLSLSFTPHSIPEDTMKIIERFVIFTYDKISRCTDIDKARRKMFAKRLKAEQIPPTFDALELHLRREIYQGGCVWAQALLTQPVLPSPTGWGWTKDDNGVYVPKWTTLPLAAKACYELLCCGCKKGCRKNCRCKRANLECTGLCHCQGRDGNAFESRLAR